MCHTHMYNHHNLAHLHPQKPKFALPRGIMITNDDGPPGPSAPFLLTFTRVLQRRLREPHEE